MRPALLVVLLAACSAPPGVPDAGMPVDAGPNGDGGYYPAPASYDCSGAPLPARKAKPDPCLVDRTCRTRLVAAHRGAGGQLGALDHFHGPPVIEIITDMSKKMGILTRHTCWAFGKPTWDGSCVLMHCQQI